MISSELGGKEYFGSNWGFPLFGIFIGMLICQLLFVFNKIFVNHNEFGMCDKKSCIRFAVLINTILALLGALFGYLSYKFYKDEKEDEGLGKLGDKIGY